ncbi:MAG: ATP-binding protein [Pseudomonadota bacterium]
MPVRLGALAEPVIYIPRQMRLTEVVQRFVNAPHQQHLIVTEEGAPSGLVSRLRALELAITAKTDTLGALTAADMAQPVLQLDTNMPAALVAIKHQANGYEDLQNGALVTENGQTLGHMSLPSLLQAVARENAARAKAMKRLSKTVSATEKVDEHTPSPSTVVPEKPDAPSWPDADMLATLAHEVRTPLTGMIGLAEMLTKRIRDTEQRGLAESIMRSGETLDRILHDTLDLASLRAGKLEVTPEPSSVSDLVVDLRRLWSTQADAKGLSFSVSLLADGPYRVEADLGKVQQVANNLISNALKFTETGGVDVLVSTHDDDGELSLMVEVSDTGPGLTSAQKNEVFRAFNKGSALRGEPGWGLGLTISKGLSSHLGGTLTVEDNPHGGSVFTMCIPVKPALSKVTTLPQTRRPKYGKFNLGEILLVEDHEPSAMVLQDALEEAGWTVHHAHSLAAAEACLRRSAFQAVLTDLHLMDGSALSLIESIRYRGLAGPDVPVLALTADTSPLTGEVATAKGADRVLQKPVRGPELVAHLADAVVKRTLETVDLSRMQSLVAAS